MARQLLQRHVDKRIQHHMWEAARLKPNQIMYAAADAYAHLCVALRLADPAPLAAASTGSGDLAERVLRARDDGAPETRARSSI